MIKLGSTVFVYYVDNALLCRTPFDKKTIDSMYRRLKFSFFFVCFIIELAEILQSKVNDKFYDPEASDLNFVTSTLMIVWYLNEGYQYGLELKED